MSLFAFGMIGFMGLGPTMAGWIEANPSLEWQWIQWVYAMCSTIPDVWLLCSPFV